MLFVERRGSSESVEDMLLREVEREREDKLCVICVDKEKCIMILPCRYYISTIDAFSTYKMADQALLLLC
jgi:hypothetical protein